MTTLKQAMSAFLADLELTEKQYEIARDQRDRVHDVLKEGLSVAETIFSGSFARQTAIRPLNDIDIFIVLSRKAHGALLDGHPRACLEELKKVLDDAWPNKEHPIVQNRSVRVDFAGTGIGYDVVPAFRDAEDQEVYTIPNRDTGCWIQSNPRAHKDYANQRNTQAGQRAKPLVKALKHWNQRFQDPPLKSFHLELMVYSLLGAPPESDAHGLAALFEGLVSRVKGPCPDPAGLGPDVDQGMSDRDRKRASDLLEMAGKDARAAVVAAADGDTEAAHYLWRRVFGDRYPEAGKEPTTPAGRAPAVAVAGRTATDAASRRFG